MLGYIRPRPSELRLREYECYRAYYCGLCRAMGSCTGQCSRMTLSYDFVFLAAVRCYLTGETPTVKAKRCIAHPFRPRKAVLDSEQLRYCADASALLSYHKCRDDRLDEKGFRRMRAALASLFLASAYRRAKKRHLDLDHTIKDALDRLHIYETTEGVCGADEPAALFGEVMRAVFTEGLNDSNARLAGEIGQTVGRWLYLVDAIDDLEDDRKKGRFNPYLTQFGGDLTEGDREAIRIALNATLSDTERAFLLMDSPPCPELQEILANILYLGLPDAAEKALLPPDQKPKKTNRKGDRI